MNDGGLRNLRGLHGLLIAILGQAQKDAKRGDLAALQWLARVGYDMAAQVHEGGEYVVEKYVLMAYGVI